MAEWFKAAVLKTASPATRRGGGRNMVTEHKGTWVRRPKGGGGSEALHHMVHRAKRASTSYSFVVDEKGNPEQSFLERLIAVVEGWPSGLRRRS